MAEILVVDDEVGIRELLSEILADEGHSIMLAENATRARELRASRRPDLVLLDIWMPDADGISLLKEWSANGLLTMPVVMMSGHGTIDTAVEATRIGAVDFLEKPIALQKLLATVKKCLKPDASATRQHYAVDSLLQIGLLKKFGQRIAQSAKHSPILFLRGAQGLIAEVGARSLLTPHAPWLNLSQESRAITQEMLEQNAGGVLFLPELHGAGRMAQMNLSFVLDRLAKYRLTLVVASSVSAEAIIESGVDAALVNRLSDVWVGLPAISESANDLPELLPALLTLLCEQGNVPHRGFDSRRYGRVRLWGSLGFLVTVFVAGAWFEADGMHSFPLWSIGSLVLLNLSVWWLPNRKEVAHHDEERPPVMAVLRQHQVQWFFATVFFHVLSHIGIYVFFSLYLDELGYSKTMIGVLWAVSVGAEIVWFFTQSRWLPIFSLSKWMFICSSAMVVRMVLTTWAADWLWALLLAQVLHALTFATQHTACIALLSHHFPGRLRGRGQALYASIGYGVPGVLGALAGGALSDVYGLTSVYGVSIVTALLACGCARQCMRKNTVLD